MVQNVIPLRLNCPGVMILTAFKWTVPLVGLLVILAVFQATSALDDVCSQPKKVGPCRASKPRFYFNRESGSCESFNYGGCGGNGNNFATAAECMEMCSSDRCSQPKKVGHCRASMPRFYFNRETGSCESFVYGGCDANGNNFATEAECKEMCGVDPCSQRKKVGPCRASKLRFYFNRETGTCESFVYGGCDANGNNFRTEAECKEMCGGGPCSQPKKVGPCRAAKPRFYFNRETGNCESFDYGGCDANGNNFRTEAECNEMCIGGPCSQPKKVGPCRAAIPRFYFNRETGSCESFDYGGCGGNGNNFRIEAECNEMCSVGNK